MSTKFKLKDSILRLYDLDDINEVFRAMQVANTLIKNNRSVLKYKLDLEALQLRYLELDYLEDEQLYSLDYSK